MYTEQNNYLCHYGVLGMKWGRRKTKKLRKSGDHLAANEQERRNEALKIL